MVDLEFYNVPISGRTLSGRILSPFRRVARKLLLPFFLRMTEILAELFRRLGRLDRIQQDTQSLQAELEQYTTRVAETAHAVACLDIKYDCLNVKMDQLNAKFDELNVKMESMFANFAELNGRELSLRDEFGAFGLLALGPRGRGSSIGPGRGPFDRGRPDHRLPSCSLGALPWTRTICPSAGRLRIIDGTNADAKCSARPVGAEYFMSRSIPH